MPENVTPAQSPLLFGLWGMKGAVAFGRMLCLKRQSPSTRAVGDIELGSGEQIDANHYTYVAPGSDRTANQSRCLQKPVGHLQHQSLGLHRRRPRTHLPPRCIHPPSIPAGHQHRRQPLCLGQPHRSRHRPMAKPGPPWARSIASRPRNCPSRPPVQPPPSGFASVPPPTPMAHAISRSTTTNTPPISTAPCPT